jgi:hypothetical protein
MKIDFEIYRDDCEGTQLHQQYLKPLLDDFIRNSADYTITSVSPCTFDDPKYSAKVRRGDMVTELVYTYEPYVESYLINAVILRDSIRVIEIEAKIRHGKNITASADARAFAAALKSGHIKAFDAVYKTHVKELTQ